MSIGLISIPELGVKTHLFTFDNEALINYLLLPLTMRSRVLDDFIDDCFLNGDDICTFHIYRSRKYETIVNPIASQLIDFQKTNELKQNL